MIEIMRRMPAKRKRTVMITSIDAIVDWGLLVGMDVKGKRSGER